MKISEWLAASLNECKVKTIYSVTGGGAMFMNAAFANQEGITPIYHHHEQACAMAAEGHARLTGKAGVVVVTTGPGAINALNGVFGAWTDSIPMLVLSGQVKRASCMSSYDLPNLRQLGDQEVNIIAMVKPITKYAAQIRDPESIRYHLEKALYLAEHGRPGPVWLDIPIDVQSAEIDPAQLLGFDVKELDQTSTSVAQSMLTEVLARLKQSQRPVIIAGTGVRLGDAISEFETLIRQLGIPVVTAWTHDLIGSDDPLFCGRPGTIGTRAGNFTVQNADLLLILGSRMNVRQTSYNWQALAPNALKIQVDIDAAELCKPTFKPDVAICADLKPFLSLMSQALTDGNNTLFQRPQWLARCKARLIKYPNVSPIQRQYNGKINPYYFIESLIAELDKDDIIVCGNATACIVPFQTAQLKRGQRLFSNSGSASMGYDLPAAIGAYFGALADRSVQRRVICFAGDGSLQMNIQELQTLVNYNIPVKLFVLNNAGYLSIRSSQQNFFGRLSGAGPESGVSLPNYTRIATAYGIESSTLNCENFLPEVRRILATSGPYLCEVILDEKQGFEPRMSSRQLENGQIVTPPLEDMFPFLDKEELAINMDNSNYE